MASITIARALTADDDVRLLVGELEGELAQNYPAEQRHGLSIDEIFQPHILFFVARLGDTPAGCGGAALLPGFAEVKRMYVRESLRGQGIADAIIARLESEVAGTGRDLLRLETGTVQHAAMRFYERSGFRFCQAFPPYVDMPPQTLAGSVFMEKRLSE